jgi:mannose-6-phosphate isomerase-like protein (cupin superfamily)
MDNQPNKLNRGGNNIMTEGTIIGLDEVEPKAGYCGSIYEMIGPGNSSAKLMDCVLVEIAPGGRSRPHRHIAGEEIYFVVAGTGVLHLGSQMRAVCPGYVAFIPPGIRHVIENNSSTPLQLFVVNAPPYQAENVLFEEEQEG